MCKPKYWAWRLTARLQGCCPPSLCVATISRETGDGRLTSEIYAAHSPAKGRGSTKGPTLP